MSASALMEIADPQRIIVIVDDEPQNLKLLEAQLRPLQCEVRSALGGREAIKVLNRASVDLVIADLVMPELDGVELVEHIRQRKGSHVPVILVTALGDPTQRVRALEAGADDYLEKPVQSEVLLARTRNLLRLRVASESLEQNNHLLKQLQTDQQELFELLVHDLKNPLAVVQANLEFLKSSIVEMEDDTREALEDAREAGERVQRLVEEILIATRLERADFPLSLREVSVLPMFEQVRRANRREAERRGVRVDIAAVEPRLATLADPLLLRRVIENLVDNGLRHACRGGVVRLDAINDGGIEILIGNTGERVEPADRDLIFEKYGQGRDAGRRLGSVGLGLYLCKRVALAHGGDIQVRESVEWPTLFVLRLPSAVVE